MIFLHIEYYFKFKKKIIQQTIFQKTFKKNLRF
jgi:hypothetical protein